MLAADVEVDGASLVAAGSNRDGDRAGGGGAAGRLCHRKTPDFVREVVGEECREHAGEVRALTELLVGLRLRANRNRNVGQRLAVVGHDADEQCGLADRPETGL